MSEHIKRILVPLDGSGLAESVMPTVAVVAGCLDAEVVLLHIIEEHAPHTVHGEPHLTSTEDAERYLGEVAARYPALKVAERHVHGTEENNVAQSIAKHVEEMQAGMIALCTHGRSGLRRAVSGSIAQQVLRKAAAPVLVVRPRTQPPEHIQRLLVPLDGKATSELAFEAAGEFANSCGGAINLTMVVPTVTTITSDLMPSARMIPTATRETLNVEEEQSRDYMKGVLERLRARGLRANCAVLRGETVQTLAETAEQTGIDLIIIATHGRSGLDATFTGSVAAGLIGRVTQPVLMVKIVS
ncbi:MAG: universal stress protein [Chloroflexia bacterium]